RTRRAADSAGSDRRGCVVEAGGDVSRHVDPDPRAGQLTAGGLHRRGPIAMRRIGPALQVFGLVTGSGRAGVRWSIFDFDPQPQAVDRAGIVAEVEREVAELKARM